MARRGKTGGGRIILTVLLLLCTAVGGYAAGTRLAGGTAVLFPGVRTPAIELPWGTIPSFAIPRVAFGEPALTAPALPEAAVPEGLPAVPPAEGAGGDAAAASSAVLAKTEDGTFAALRAYLHEQVWNGARTITFRAADYGSPSEEDLHTVMESLYFMPDMFALQGFTGQLRTSLAGLNREYSLTPVYREEIYAVYEEAKALVARELNAISAQVDPGWTDLQKVLFLHDYVAVHYAYDEAYARFDLYSMLRDGRGVCQAYTLLMAALLERAGIQCSYVTSTSLNHRWNMVELDGQWYHLDVTWDDPTPDGLGYVSHTWFLLSGERMKTLEDGRHFLADDWVLGQDAACDSARYEQYPWRDAVSPFLPVRGNWCYVDSRSLRYWDGQSADGQSADGQSADGQSAESGELVSFRELYERIYPQYLWKDDVNYAAASGLFLRDGWLYFNTWFTVLRYDPAGGGLEVAWDAIEEDGVVGCAPDGDTLACRLSNGRNHYVPFPDG